MTFIRGAEAIGYLPAGASNHTHDRRAALSKNAPHLIDNLERLNNGAPIALVPFGSVAAGLAGERSDTDLFAIKIGGYENFGASSLVTPKESDGIHIEGILASSLGLTGLDGVPTALDSNFSRTYLLALAAFLVGDVYVRGEEEVRLVQLRRSELVSNLKQGGEKGEIILQAAKEAYMQATVRYIGADGMRREKRTERLQSLGISESLQSAWEEMRIQEYSFPTLDQLAKAYLID